MEDQWAGADGRFFDSAPLRRTLFLQSFAEARKSKFKTRRDLRVSIFEFRPFPQRAFLHAD